jgi:two-component system, OmpR family, KDP operon response regulator KdpE
MNQESAALRPTVLVIDDEPQLRRFLRTGLVPRGFTVREASDGAEGLRMAEEFAPDVILLDLGLPDLDGVDVVLRLRAWSPVPIVVLSARERESEKVRALDAGADDYLTKPFGFDELLARLRVALRHRAGHAGEADRVIHCGPLTLDRAARRVFVDGKEVRLTRVEFNLLVTLATHAGRVLTHRQLLEAVWGPHKREETHYVRVYMTHLRRKLEPDPSHPRLFVTEAGVGYRLNCE